jgi:hypothetical protein
VTKAARGTGAAVASAADTGGGGADSGGGVVAATAAAAPAAGSAGAGATAADQGLENTSQLMISRLDYNSGHPRNERGPFAAHLHDPRLCHPL